MSNVRLTKIVNEVEVDMEWLELLKEAVEMGITKEEIRNFFIHGKKL